MIARLRYNYKISQVAAGGDGSGGAKAEIQWVRRTGGEATESESGTAHGHRNGRHELWQPRPLCQNPQKYPGMSLPLERKLFLDKGQK